jgi:hypothetical protein
MVVPGKILGRIFIDEFSSENHEKGETVFKTFN